MCAQDEQKKNGNSGDLGWLFATPRTQNRSMMIMMMITTMTKQRASKETCFGAKQKQAYIEIPVLQIVLGAKKFLGKLDH